MRGYPGSRVKLSVRRRVFKLLRSRAFLSRFTGGEAEAFGRRAPARLPATQENPQRSPERHDATNREACFLPLPSSGPRSACGPGAARPGLEPASTGGLAEVDRALARLSTNKRLLVIGAHPDDEDTSLIALVSRGLGGDAAYLSLSRGEGGQNVIGPELGVGLGLLRSPRAAGRPRGRRRPAVFHPRLRLRLHPLARRDPPPVAQGRAGGGCRAGHSPLPAAGRGLRLPGVPHPNHGQHQAAGVTAYAAFPLAGDAAALPQVTAEGFAPWTPQALYRSTYFDPNASTMTLSTRRRRSAGGEVDLPARHGQPQHAPLAGHGTDPAPRRPADAGGLGARRARQGCQGTLRRHRHPPFLPGRDRHRRRPPQDDRGAP